jgi:acetyl esterase/lipase
MKPLLLVTILRVVLGASFASAAIQWGRICRRPQARARMLARIAAAWAVAAICSACAPMNERPADITDKIRSSGPVVDGRGMAALYAPLQEKDPYVGVRVTRDLSYGPDPHNLADVFAPKEASGRRLPVLIFVHGGGFTAGERRLSPDSPFYDNVGVWAVRHGLIGVNINYRLAPQGKWPAGAEDVGRAVDWVRRTISAQGGDPKRIFLMGHSAGATHVAGYVSHRQFWSGTGPEIKGAIIVSGTFDVTIGPALPDEKSFVERDGVYFDEDPARQSEQSSLAGLVASPVPFLIVNAEFDPPYFARRAAALKAAFRAAHRVDRFVVISGQSHMGEIFSINSTDQSLSREIGAFIRHR